MNGGAGWRGAQFSVLLMVMAWVPLSVAAQEPPIRAKSVLHFSFDEMSGDAQDSAMVGQVKDVGQMVNGATRVRSPFANQQGKLALILDGGRKQFVQVADGADVDRPAGVSLSFFYLHLGSAEDPAYHSLFAKRTEGAGQSNYGINFSGKNDQLQVYLNDGSGYKLTHFSVQKTLGFRRPGFVTVTYEIGDAPGEDADQDPDDVRVRLYVNGQQQTPIATPTAQLAGNDAWLLNVNLPGLVNDVPLLIGASTPTIEFASGLFDEFSLFSQALTADEVSKLFIETAGPNASTAVLADTLPGQLAAPAIASLSVAGLQSGSTSTVVISGTNLQPSPVVSLPVSGAKITLGPNTNANQIEALITLPADAAVGHYPLRIQTAGGISNALPVAVDGLPEVAAGTSSPDKPYVLPVAVSGVLSGAQQIRAYFAGQAGQHVVADIESRRLGAAMTPVIEIKTARGTPLKIEWGHVEFSGDARATVSLPANGLYYVELHDLSYAAPGVNPFRLKVGDLKLADVALGGATVGKETQLALSGTGTDPATKLPIDLRNQTGTAARDWPLPANLGIAAPAPKLVVSLGPEYVETPVPGGQFQVVEAKFTAAPPHPVGFTGLLAQRRERDVLLLQVTPGQRLKISASGAAVNSPLDPQLQVLRHPDGAVLASAENPGTREAETAFDVPADQTQVQVAVRDLRQRGGDNFRYRIRVAPADQVDFSLALSADRVQMAADGSAALQIDATRSGYNGPIKLSVLGDPQVSISPAEIPAGVLKAWVTLSREGAAPAGGSFDRLQIAGESTDVTPPISRMATVPADGRLSLLPAERTTLATGFTTLAGATLELGPIPGSLYRGYDFTLPLQLKVADGGRARIARLTLLSTEAGRPINPANPSQGQKPRVDGGLHQVIEAGAPATGLQITVPTDVADPNIDLVVKAELVEHPFSQNVVATIYSKPFRLPVQNAVTTQLASSDLRLKGATATKFAGSMKRTVGFTAPVTVQILNLPAGTTVPPVTVAADQENFELVVTPAAVTAAAAVPNVVFRVTSGPSATPLLPDMPLTTRIEP